MKQKISIICLLVLCCSSYSQQKENKIIMFPISTNDSIKRNCDVLNFREYSHFDLYTCSSENNIIYTSLVQDTIFVDILIKICLHFTDSFDCFFIEKIEKVRPAVIISDTEEEKRFINELIFNMMKDSKFYYDGKKEELEGIHYFFLTFFKLMPDSVSDVEL